jgi:hypothetical protein
LSSVPEKTPEPETINVNSKRDVKQQKRHTNEEYYYEYQEQRNNKTYRPKYDYQNVWEIVEEPKQEEEIKPKTIKKDSVTITIPVILY